MGARWLCCIARDCPCPSPDARCAHPGLRSLDADFASPSMAALVSNAGSRARAAPRFRPQEAQSRKRWGHAGSAAPLGTAHARRRTLASGSGPSLAGRRLRFAILASRAAEPGSRARAAPRCRPQEAQSRKRWGHVGFAAPLGVRLPLSGFLVVLLGVRRPRGNKGERPLFCRAALTHFFVAAIACDPLRITPTRVTLVATYGCGRRGWRAAALPLGQLPRSGDRQGLGEMLRAGDSFPRPRRG